jgi:hypothetical protein
MVGIDEFSELLRPLGNLKLKSGAGSEKAGSSTCLSQTILVSESANQAD